jgi:thiosulfate reductase cytochrome b subunit
LPHSTRLDKERIATRTPALQPGVRVVRKHHVLVRVTHWLNIPLLLGLIVSGISIYWASPIYRHTHDPQTGIFDYFADAGIWICAHLPGLRDYASPPDWLYNHLSLGPYMLALALRFHWLCAFLFMLSGLVYLAGVFVGGEWRALLPRLSDARSVLRTAGYYLGTPLIRFQSRRQNRLFNTKCNPLRRLAYFSIPVVGLLSVLTGWAIHKPMQLSWLAALFDGYDRARIWHFWLMWTFILFAVPHVALVFADGWDTVRSMITGWSTKLKIGSGAE